MVSYIYKTAMAIVIVGLLMTGMSYGAAAENSAPKSKSEKPSSANAEKKAADEAKERKEFAIGIIGGMHEMVREERIAALTEIDKQRQETLAYLTEERRTVMDELKEELHRTTEVLLNERVRLGCGWSSAIQEHVAGHLHRKRSVVVFSQSGVLYEDVVVEAVIAPLNIVEPCHFGGMGRMVWCRTSQFCSKHDTPCHQVVRIGPALRHIQKGDPREKQVVVHEKRTVIDFDEQVFSRVFVE